LRPVPDSAERYVAAIRIDAGVTYRLDGTIDGVQVDAETTVPAPLELVVPAADTIDFADGQIQQIPIRWRAPGASLLLSTAGFFLLQPAGSGALPRTRDTVTTLILAPSGTAVDSVELWALNPDADRYLFDLRSPRGNVRGGFGMLGGAARARRIVRWQ
jgi:hypothetical protein